MLTAMNRIGINRNNSREQNGPSSEKLTPTRGDIIPTRAYHKRTDSPVETATKPGRPAIKNFQRKFYGATYLFDAIGDITGLTADLKACFPESYRQTLSIAYYLILEENNALNRFSHWQKLTYPSIWRRYSISAK